MRTPVAGAGTPQVVYIIAQRPRNNDCLRVGEYIYRGGMFAATAGITAYRLTQGADTSIYWLGLTIVMGIKLVGAGRR